MWLRAQALNDKACIKALYVKIETSAHTYSLTSFGLQTAWHSILPMEMANQVK